MQNEYQSFRKPPLVNRIKDTPRKCINNKNDCLCILWAKKDKSKKNDMVRSSSRVTVKKSASIY